MDELLKKTGVSSDMYLCGLKICSTGNSVVMKRKPSESWINTYNSNVIRVWKANMDLQYILDLYACVMYIDAYTLNSKECGSEDISLDQSSSTIVKSVLKKQSIESSHCH